MSHTLLHQFLVSDLVVPVGLAQEPGHECLTGFGAHLAGGTFLRPDLMVFPRERAEGGPRHVTGAPALAIEVVSPASREADLLAKRDLYARSGVPAYWVVDTGGGEPEVVVHESPGEGRYAARERVPWGASLRLSRPFGIVLTPEEIFRPPRRAVPMRRAAMPDLPADDAAGPGMPYPEEPIRFDVFRGRWPTGAEKVELWEGCPVFYGEWDERDVEIAQRAYPGRVVRLDQPPGEPGTMTVLPAPASKPESDAASRAASENGAGVTGNALPKSEERSGSDAARGADGPPGAGEPFESGIVRVIRPRPAADAAPPAPEAADG
ncbi:Uma2 family endonuclease [Actinomadura graeca]|uniref:Uma2 family endonuclease n=1 Tax=Actinomadura graeca TaxID=2750812 RepID=A0ABX8R453_9ACTN|nr:Uma2 family endonuclease [Actinomadura graeca]QXJ25059.1 Uma2 family endonuclease [Actinomadura graeca]